MSSELPELVMQGDCSKIILQQAPCAIAIFDNNMHYLATSDRWLIDYELQGIDILGKSHYEIFPDVPSRWKEIHKDCLSGNIRECAADPFSREDGSVDWISWKILPWHCDGEIAGIIMLTEVITPQVQLKNKTDSLELAVRDRTQELELARREAETANRAKSHFLSRMSHELRTPLNSILGFVQLLQLELEDKQYELESVAEIERAGEHLLALINEVLNISKIESGRLDLKPQAIKIEDFIQDIIAMLRPLARESDISILYTIGEQIPAEIIADFKALKHIIINLLSNAIKYNKHGGNINVTVNIEKDDIFSLSVEDTGRGIKSEDLDKLFEPFTRVGRNLNIEGSGIGLSVAQQMAKLMGGNISCTSEIDKGSSFVLKFPTLWYLEL